MTFSSETAQQFPKKLENIKTIINQLNMGLKVDDETIRTKEFLQELQYLLKELNNLKFALDVSTIVAITDVSGQIIYVNDKFCEISKYSRDELIGRTHRVVNSGYHSKEFMKEVWDTILSKNIWKGIIQNKAKDGSFFWVSTVIVPILKEDGEISSFISIRSDVTSEKQMEAQLRDAIKNDFKRTVKALTNVVFKLKKDEADNIYFTLFEGKLARRILKNKSYFDKTPFDLFSPTIASFLMDKYTQAFHGNSVSYNHAINGVHLFTTLSPIKENGKVIEVIGSSNDITSLTKAERKLNHMAYHDSLTNLPNRRRFFEDYSNNLKEIKGTSSKFAILFLDLDLFKRINDTLGHPVGDLLLCEVGRRLISIVHQNNKVYRLGGDEFLIFVPAFENMTEIMNIAKAITSRIQDPFYVNSHEFFITASIGISVYPDDGKKKELLMRNADIALNYCKSQGKRNFYFFNKSMNATYNEKLLLESDLINALDRNELQLVYQPKVEIMSEKIIGFEALARWNHPKFGFISPTKFIPIAEETGVILRLGEWVLYQACRQTKEWLDKGIDAKPVAVNISAIEFQRPNFFEKVKSILDKTGLEPNYLELELTENSMFYQTDKNDETLKSLKKLGVSISLDDFGKGYSSFGYLKKLPIDKLKIDQSFVRTLFNDESNSSIVRALIQLSKTFGLKVIAEGVETKDTFEFLRNELCDECQGFYFSKPLSVDKLEKLLSV